MLFRSVQFCNVNKLYLENISLSELQSIHSSFDEKSIAVLPHKTVMKARISAGGTAPAAVIKQIQQAKQLI